jgi:hypothetical protein
VVEEGVGHDLLESREVVVCMYAKKSQPQVLSIIITACIA